MSAQACLELGYVARAHGLRGEVAVKSFDPASETLGTVERVRLRLRSGEEREYALETFRPANKEDLVCFEGVESRTAAEALVGAKVFVYREDLEPPEEGEFFQGDLVGLNAVDEQGASLGTVEEVWATGEVPNLVIRAKGRPELVVPFADEFVPAVDVPAGRIVIRPPEYLDADDSPGKSGDGG
ncbi:ribosome maturation factor RimM [Corallococcus interemptor]|uniref:ribosome maturation factor RimM n=1 Tax=Corallococcus TaxID=83461 RepID=UPI001CBF75AF|nr:ribosome maturation factor RimM [Corallococcus sp. AS-1-12]MBZ4373102.1 ribosome maturation factor RimM [Corallococcus sp. AS-1-6]